MNPASLPDVYFLLSAWVDMLENTFRHDRQFLYLQVSAINGGSFSQDVLRREDGA